MGDVEPVDPFSVTEKHVVIVGGAAGIGLAVAEHLVGAGASLST